MKKTPVEAVELLNSEYYIPTIQRRFVWEKEQISMLFDSILREFPIGQMLVKESSVQEVSDNPTYKFVQNYIVDNIPNFEKGNHANPQEKNIESNPVKLVFDGQQRLTALNIGLNGCIYERDNKYKTKKKENYVRKYLCMNLVSDPSKPVEDAESFDQSKGGNAPHYEFAFKKEENVDKFDDEGYYWFKVSKIKEVDSMTDCDNFIRESNVPSGFERDATRNLMELYEKLHRNSCVDISSVRDKDNDEMLEIFLRMNRSGTQISDSDTALSIMTYRWDENDNVVAREDIESYVSDINTRFDYNRSPMSEKTMITILKLCSVPKSSLDTFKPNISIEELTDRENKLTMSMKKVWNDDEFKDAVDEYIKLCKDFSIPTRRIGSSIIFAPIVTYIYFSNSVNLDKESKRGLLNRQRILYWICSSVSLGLSSSATSRRAKNATEAIYENMDTSFPLENIIESVESELSLRFEEDTLDLCDITEGFYSDTRATLLLKLTQIHRFSKQEYETKQEYDKDHIYPRSLVNSEKVDNLGNIQYIKSRTNRKKKDTDFSNWVSSMTREYKKNHYIPESIDSSSAKFEDFVEERENIISKNLQKICDVLVSDDEPIEKHPSYY